MSCYTLKCNVFVVKNHLLDSDIFLFNPTRGMGVPIITVLALQNIITMYYDLARRKDQA